MRRHRTHSTRGNAHIIHLFMVRDNWHRNSTDHALGAFRALGGANSETFFAPPYRPYHPHHTSVCWLFSSKACHPQSPPPSPLSRRQRRFVSHFSRALMFEIFVEAPGPRNGEHQVQHRDCRACFSILLVWGPLLHQERGIMSTLWFHVGCRAGGRNRQVGP